MLTGGLRTATTMRTVLRDGSVDVVGLARPLALEPDLPDALLQGTTQGSGARALQLGWTPVDAMVEAGWYGLQMARLADGRDPAPDLARWRAIAGYLGAEARNAAIRSRGSRGQSSARG